MTISTERLRAVLADPPEFAALMGWDEVRSLITEVLASRSAAGWRSWAGGPQPVDNDTLVDYRMRRDGPDRHGTNTADVLFWHHDGCGDDIVEWRPAGLASRSAGAEGREAVIEECAKVAEGLGAYWSALPGDQIEIARKLAAQDIAAAIRSLKENSHGA